MSTLPRSAVEDGFRPVSYELVAPLVLMAQLVLSVVPMV
jgi:hypothetical protein